jgi:hypothetical protein
MAVETKTIGASGQISLGKQHAGKTVIVDQIESGVWLVKTAQVIPDSELWLHTPEAQEKLRAGIEWAETHPVQVSDLDEVEKKLMAHLRKRERPRRAR